MSKPIHAEAQERLADCPTSTAGILKRAYSAKAAPRGAIKAFCLQCVGYVRADVAGCTSLGCPLWHYRPYQAGDAEDTE